jgi:hypothetical protein
MCLWLNMIHTSHIIQPKALKHIIQPKGLKHIIQPKGLKHIIYSPRASETVDCQTALMLQRWIMTVCMRCLHHVPQMQITP